MQVLTWFGVLIGLIASTLAIFSYLENRNGSLVKSRALQWMSTAIPIRVAYNWASVFSDTFDAMFGSRFLSIRFATMSAISSIVFIVLLILLWFTLYPHEAEEYVDDPFLTIFLVGLILVFTNILPDFLSNCQTRYILGKLVASVTPLDSKHSVRSSVKWLTIDLALTAFLSALVVVPTAIFITNLMTVPWIRYTAKVPNPFDPIRFIQLHATEIHVYFPSGGNSRYYTSYTLPFGAFFYSTFLTSIWLWMYTLSGLTIRMLHWAFGPESALIEWFGFRNHPLRAQGEVCAIVLGAAYIILSAIAYFLPNSP